MTNDTQITVPTLAPNAENMAALAAWAESVPKAVESARKRFTLDLDRA